MDKASIIKALETAKNNSSGRNFSQTVDLIINLKNIDLKKPDHQIDSFHALPHGKGKKVKVCALVGPELAESAAAVDKAIFPDDWQKLKKNEIKKLAQDYDFFIAQANLMPKIATVFGRVLGPRGKMPNPKAGCVVPPNANLGVLYERLQKMIRIANKKSPVLQCAVGVDGMAPEQIAENVLSVYTAALQLVPSEKNSIRNMLIKLTMGKPVPISETAKLRVKER